MQDKINKLVHTAKRRMKNSNDPIHDRGHVERVAKYAKEISKNMNLSLKQRQALILASYWHDMARSVTKNPSLLWMVIVDDIISALMLWKTAVRYKLFGTAAGIAVKIIFCKSLGTGALLTKILFRKKNRILVDIVQDADAIDMLYQERTIKMMRLAESSRLYHFGYKFTMWWCVKTAELHVKTEQARKYIEDMLRAFLTWIKEKHIWQWHVEQFGLEWSKKTMKQAMELLEYIISPNYKAVTIKI